MKTVIAMSGGVDSSAAALIIKDRGDECIGVTLRLCPELSESENAEEDAAKVAAGLGMEHRIVDMCDEFYRRVIDGFVSEYECGRTPNPCIECNRYLKFGALLDYALSQGYDRVATGHYAMIGYDAASERYLLKKGADPAKDQSYVLYNLTQSQLAHVEFPLGGMSKDEVRAVASRASFVTAHKRDSQDICFVPDGDYAGFIERYSGKSFLPGDFIGPDGSVIGKHKGHIRYTMGQRKGLGLSLPEPLYVTEKRISDNTVHLGRNSDLMCRHLTARDVNLISVSELSSPMRVEAKVRYNQRPAPAEARLLSDGRLEVLFDEPQRAVTPGQSVVLYDGDTVVGGGKIE